MGTVASLWRYPIKSHGREALASLNLIAGQTIPWDRHWAVTHQDAKFDTNAPAWAMCRNFMIGAATPSLAGISARLDTATATVTLTHPELDTITFRPDDADDAARFITWVTPICPVDARRPAQIVHVPDRGMTDTAYASVSLMNVASHAAVAEEAGADLSSDRWRGNIWLDGIAAWDEWTWIGKQLTVGDVVFNVKERIKRCSHTAANPKTGQRDIDCPRILRDTWGHQDFGVYAEVIQGGTIRLGDKMKVN